MMYVTIGISPQMRNADVVRAQTIVASVVQRAAKTLSDDQLEEVHARILDSYQAVEPEKRRREALKAQRIETERCAAEATAKRKGGAK